MVSTVRAKALTLVLLGLFFGLAPAAEAAPLDVKTEALYGFDLSLLTACSWTEGQPAANFEIERTIRQSVEKRLRAKGRELVEVGADCLVRTRVIRERAFPVAVLLVELVEPEGGRAVWRGEVGGLTTYSLSKIERLIAKSIKKMFRELPRID